MKERNKKRPYAYLAGPLFSSAERTFNARLKRRLTNYFDIYLPQEDGELLVDLIESGVPSTLASQRIYNRDIDEIHKADVMIAILDGRAIDEGVAYEVGFAKALGKKCYGLQTDPRRLVPSGNNPMIENALERTFATESMLLRWAKTFATSNHNVERIDLMARERSINNKSHSRTAKKIRK